MLGVVHLDGLLRPLHRLFKITRFGISSGKGTEDVGFSYFESSHALVASSIAFAPFRSVSSGRSRQYPGEIIEETEIISL